MSAVRREVLASSLDPFTTALRTGVGAATTHLPALPRDAEGFARAADAARREVAPPPGPLVEALVAYQREHGLGTKAEANAKALGGGALAVVTGQQPGLFGGPLLTLHKAVGAIALARRIEESGGGRVVPVFWVASEDHDFAEANRAAVIDASGAIHALSLDVVADLRSVRDVPLSPDAMRAVVASLASALPPTERAAAAVALATPARPTDMGAWFATCLGRLLGDTGLVVVEPHVVAPWAGPVFARLVRDAEKIGEAVRVAGDRLRADGLAAPLAPPPGSAPMFLRDAVGGRRLRVSLDGDAVRLRGEPSPLDRAALEAKVLASPHLASGDVVGRVFVQNATLPVLAYVGGPTELAYLAQVRAAHAVVAARFPLAAPRPQATWVEPKVLKAVEAFGLTVADVLAGKTPTAGARAPDDRAAQALRETRRQIAESAEGLKDAPTAARALRESLESIDGALHEMEKEREDKAGRGAARWDKALASLRPGGHPQERALSPLSLVARYGVDALREGLSLLDPLAPGHQILFLP